ncbi:MAG: hypothetical protein F6K09_15310 [Merismopedia sp. SIO2A8]|nr:hypothetical protein [Merismopedia sp. SIO2A8]
MLQETHPTQTESFNDALRSYQSLFAEQLYEGMPVGEQTPLRHQYQHL